MGYPSQPQGPYGQNQPQQQPYGYSGPQPGYGYQPPAPPPPPRRNIGLIILLAVGIPLLLMGGCAAIVLVAADTGREAVVTTADPPNAVLPSKLPESSAPVDKAVETQPAEQPVEQPTEQQQADQGPSTATIGGSITLAGRDPGLQVAVTVVKLINPATPAEDFLKPKSGNKFVALEVTLQNAGQAVYSDSPTNGATLIDGQGQQYRSTVYRVREGQSFGGSATINTGDIRRGVIVFEVPEAAKLTKFQFALDSGFAEQKGEWTLN
ncbi:protein of unknown function [Nonomuraea solani]|uniref:DUF4352 domain-containing protein n=1 Tax=Nonomuraea solani TaxID=1144553 RepID=A0A1H6ESI9_9ACTN|nr:DUF4352 domain-containing protein [Nonomuraea solani]SEH00353.1 protein of unknown function [Nonomuraea solani]